MDAIVCPGCHLSVIPIRIFEQSKRTKQWYRITKCSRERCGFNIDLDECDKPAPRNTGPKDENDRRSFWNYGL